MKQELEDVRKLLKDCNRGTLTFTTDSITAIEISNLVLDNLFTGYFSSTPRCGNDDLVDIKIIKFRVVEC